MIRTMLISSASWLCAVALLASVGSARAQTADSAAPNILVIVGDDMGVETLGRFGIGEEPATTPALDALADRGVIFTNTWSQAMCSPARATMLTGRYGFRTGVGSPTGRDTAAGPLPDPPELPANVLEAPRPVADGMGGGVVAFAGVGWGLTDDEIALPEALAARTDVSYDKAAFGKWHLADNRNGWQDHPNRVGFDHFSGLISCCTESYFSWTHLENGSFSHRTGYAESDKVDDVIAWLGDPSVRDEPWFVWLAFNAPHTPFHLPPADLLQNDYTEIAAVGDIMPNNGLVFRAMIEAMDAEIGRLLEHIGPEVLANTYVIFIGDNGTDNRVVTAPFQSGRGKGSLYNGGIHVPLLVAGPEVTPGSASDALTNATDLYATILDIAGVELSEAVPEDVHVDSVSLVPYFSDPQRDSIREWIYADRFLTDEGVGSGSYTIRDHRFKLLVNEGTEEFYDLQADPLENANLLSGELSGQETAALDELRARISELHDSEDE